VVCSALIGASRPQQVLDAVAALQAPAWRDDELAAIDAIAGHER
jgi:aryl-alcohol dehydrogenase-like predicted oxidoreductase